MQTSAPIIEIQFSHTSLSNTCNIQTSKESNQRNVWNHPSTHTGGRCLQITYGPVLNIPALAKHVLSQRALLKKRQKALCTSASKLAYQWEGWRLSLLPRTPARPGKPGVGVGVEWGMGKVDLAQEGVGSAHPSLSPFLDLIYLSESTLTYCYSDYCWRKFKLTHCSCWRLPLPREDLLQPKFTHGMQWSLYLAAAWPWRNWVRIRPLSI